MIDFNDDGYEAKEAEPETTVDQLSQIFRDNFVAYYRSHVAHVNTIGRNFYSDHKLLQKIYENLQDQIDAIAEQLRTLDAWMPCDIQDVLTRSEVDTGELEGDSDFLLEMVREDLLHLVEEYKELETIAVAENLEHISNYAQDRVTTLTKFVWMLNATLG